MTKLKPKDIPCRGDNGECDRPVYYGEDCEAHRKRRQRREKRAYTKKRPDKQLGRPRSDDPCGPVRVQLPTPTKALERASLELADAEAEMSKRKFAYVKERMRKVMQRALAKRMAKKSNPAAPKE